MCSTPFGIGDWFTAATPQIVRIAICAQRLSASEIGSPENKRDNHSVHFRVLTAFRHRRLVHPLILGSIPATRCAQRLSASEIGSPIDPRSCRNRAILCSTPFGIGDWFTLLQLAIVDHVRLCSTPFGIGDWFTAELVNQGRFKKICAQRLSASEIGSLTIEAYVLASAEQGCSTPFGIGDWFTHLTNVVMQAVLVGAQRLSASEIGSRLEPGIMGQAFLCSTPFGIGDWFTRLRCYAAQHGRKVLNAFRHRRLVHSSANLSPNWMIACSTPFGIGDWFTMASCPRMRVARSCSTPFGIGDWFTICPSAAPRLA